MAKVVHFIVSVDLDDEYVAIDHDTFDAKFPFGGLFDSETGEWREEEEDEYEKARILMREWFKND
jgi:hypothetical protein